MQNRIIDEIDYKIIEQLQDDARISHSVLAEKIGMPVSTVRDRVKRLEQRGVIKGYTAVVNAEAMGKSIMAFIRLSIGTTSRNYIEAKAEVARICQVEPDILECHGVAGEDCYVLKVRAPTPVGLEKLLERIRSQAEVSKSVTNIVLTTVKENIKIVP
ncbi:Lrp/AsnC family transcriptional regulator [Anaerolineales bacterium HSG6]|nr:Lrp/AsnC family transcriptional regulator [Anaerolineales bacterium HSG6]